MNSSFSLNKWASEQTSWKAAESKLNPGHHMNTQPPAGIHEGRDDGARQHILSISHVERAAFEAMLEAEFVFLCAPLSPAPLSLATACSVEISSHWHRVGRIVSFSPIASVHTPQILGLSKYHSMTQVCKPHLGLRKISRRNAWALSDLGDCQSNGAASGKPGARFMLNQTVLYNL